MVFLIHSLEILLVLLIVVLVFCVIRAYRAELSSISYEQSIYNVTADLKAVSIVENYIEEFFGMDSESLNPLLALREERELHTSANVCDTKLDKCRHVQEENSQSISSKVIESMMSEAELLCAS
jgi:hypothetical protein